MQRRRTKSLSLRVKGLSEVKQGYMVCVIRSDATGYYVALDNGSKVHRATSSEVEDWAEAQCPAGVTLIAVIVPPNTDPDELETEKD